MDRSIEEQIKALKNEIEGIVARHNLSPDMASVAVAQVEDELRAQIEPDLDDPADREPEAAGVSAFLDPDIDIRDLDAVEVTIYHSLGEDSVWLERDESGTWTASSGVTTLPEAYVMDDPDDALGSDPGDEDD